MYVAPAAAPTPASITVIVTPQADPARAVQATITIGGTSGGGIGVSVTPTSATRVIDPRLALTVQVTGTTDTSVSWTVNGIPGGSVEAGQICVLGSNPCQLVATASATQVDYIAPAAMPASNPVTVRVVSTVDANAFATSEIAVINHVIVSCIA